MGIPVFNPQPTIPNAKRFEADHVAGFSGGNWQRIRRHWLMRNPACNRCGLAGEEVHHIVQRAHAPHRWNDWSNLETLCKRCHKEHHNSTNV